MVSCYHGVVLLWSGFLMVECPYVVSSLGGFRNGVVLSWCPYGVVSSCCFKVFLMVWFLMVGFLMV